MKSRLVASGLCLALATGAGAAHAQRAADVDAARELFREASRLVQEGRWTEAEERYGRSLALKRAALTLYSLGVVQKTNGHFVEALESFRAFLAEPSTGATLVYETPARDAIDELEKQVARLTIVVEPAALPGVSVTVDGVPVPTAALAIPRLVNPGRHVIVASATGYRPTRVEMSSAPASLREVKLSLAVADGTLEASPPRDPAPPPLQAPPAEAPPSVALPATLMGVGGAAIIAGITVGMLGVKDASNAPTKNGPAASSAKTKALAGDVVTGVGIAAAATGLIILLVQRSGSASPPVTAGVSPWSDGATAGVRVRF